jgi:glutamyl-tRNA synthetase/glutamyl-Q tRNA(Asp) synthetase
MTLPQFPNEVVTRFAPSPTGFLHLGHIANAVFVWGIARRLGGRVVLRMEDHDSRRCRPEFEEAILEDLDWLGLQPDEGTARSFRAGPTQYRQSDRIKRYAQVLDLFGAHSLIFACDCSRKKIARNAESDENSERRYPGTCRTRGLMPGPDRGMRMIVERGSESFTDMLLGPQTQAPSQQCGDLLMRDRHGDWTYHFAVSVDDLDQGINLVIRGEDLLHSTGRQLRIRRLLGAEATPLFLHHPLIRDEQGDKLSKRDQAAGIRELRGAGESPNSVLGRAAFLVGLLEHPGEVAPSELAGLFDGLVRR